MADSGLKTRIRPEWHYGDPDDFHASTELVSSVLVNGRLLHTVRLVLTPPRFFGLVSWPANQSQWPSGDTAGQQFVESELPGFLGQVNSQGKAANFWLINGGTDPYGQDGTRVQVEIGGDGVRMDSVEWDVEPPWTHEHDDMLFAGRNTNGIAIAAWVPPARARVLASFYGDITNRRFQARHGVGTPVVYEITSGVPSGTHSGGYDPESFQYSVNHTEAMTIS